MDPTRWTRIQELFLAARALAPADRDAFLAEAAGDDAGLGDEVRSLLAADRGSDAIDELADSLLAPLAGASTPPARLGARIGPYRVVGELGRGGMACVYLAERADGQFDQQVAIKVLHRDHGDLGRRFRHERRILARLDHPGIARLIDGGTLDDGAPYLVMEYVDGEPVDRWVDSREPPPRAVIELMLQICDAVQFAHRNLVVHRDLKPGNILVTADGRVRLLDFGIAKLLADDAPDLTRPFARLLTPEYASPEQVRGDDVTTATDVYALGLVLYRLLGGVPAQSVGGLADAELRRRIVEESPAPLGDVTGDPARARLLRGDLDTIVARAIAKDPDRRYGSPGELADDLRRWLAGRPVHARPDGAGYRARKFVGRHRTGMAAAALAMLALLAGLAGTLWQAGEATRERDLARQAAAQSDQVTRFMVSLFEAADPLLSRGDTLTARQLLDRGHARMTQELSDQPRVRAAVLRAMGDAYRNLGLHDRADTLLTEVHALILSTDPVDSLALADAIRARAALDEERGRPREAAAGFRRALGIRRRILGPHHETVAASWNNLGSAIMALNRPDSAAACFAAALAAHRSRPDAPPAAVAVVVGNLASAHSMRGDLAAADSAFARADSLMRAASAGAPQRANLLSGWGVVRYRLDDLAGAAARVEEALRIWRRTLGHDHPQVGRGENNLAAILERQGHDERAEPHYRESLRIKRATLGDRHPSVARSLNNLALLLQRRGALAEAEAMLQESASIREETLPADHPQLARGWYNLARLLHDTGRGAEAEPLYRRALDLRAEVLGEGHDGTIAVAQSLAGLLRDGGRVAGAEALERRFGLELAESQSERE